MSTTGFTEDSLAVSVVLEPADEGLHNANIVGHTVAVSSGVVTVEVLVDVEDELAGATSRISDGQELRTSFGWEGLSTRPRRTGDENHLAGCTSSTNCVDSSLNSLDPWRDGWKVMGFVHDTEDDLGVAGILCGQLRPEACVLGISWSTLVDDSTVPSSIVVEINDDIGASGKTLLYGCIVPREEARVDCSTKSGCHLHPSEWNTEQVDALACKM